MQTPLVSSSNSNSNINSNSTNTKLRENVGANKGALRSFRAALGCLGDVLGSLLRAPEVLQKALGDASEAPTGPRNDVWSVDEAGETPLSAPAACGRGSER